MLLLIHQHLMILLQLDHLQYMTHNTCLYNQLFQLYHPNPESVVHTSYSNLFEFLIYS